MNFTLTREYRATPAPWTEQFSKSGTFDGLVPNLAYLQDKDLPRAPAAESTAEPCVKWIPYCLPILDQRNT
ncbi:MAG: hypothetical protein KJ579_02650, partial [Verrucomicrobia bacterium]|nr:hypothetical protein [Verrucomicrobiota bacterium]